MELLSHYSPGAEVGFVQTSFTAHEGDGSLPVCVEVKANDCIINIAINISFTTIDDTAGE